MQRRELLKRTAAAGVLAALPFPLSACAKPAAAGPAAALPRRPLARPADGSAIPVAFLVSDDTILIDVAGPWDAFLNVMPGGRMDVPTFHLYTVSETAKPIKVAGGMTIVPDFTLATAPAPKVIVIPAQSGDSDAVLDWIRSSSKNPLSAPRPSQPSAPCTRFSSTPAVGTATFLVTRRCSSIRAHRTQ